jgi:hypothetical protein
LETALLIEQIGALDAAGLSSEGIDLHLDGWRRSAAPFLPFQFAPYSTINPALEVEVTNN